MGAAHQKIAQITGYELGEIPHRGSTRTALIYEDDLEMVQKNIDALVNGEIDNYKIEFRMNRRDGSIVWVSENAIVYEWDEQGVPVRLAAIAFDLSQLKNAEQKARNMEAELKRTTSLTSEGALAEQNRLLRAGNSAAGLLIGDFYHDYETVLRISLQTLGESVQADRAFIWRNREKDGKTAFFLRSEWAVNEAQSLHINDEESLVLYDDSFPRWPERLAENTYTCAYTNELDASIQSMPGIMGSDSVMLVPLYLHGVFWGVFGFVAHKKQELFTPSEAEIMNAGGLLLASSITRNETFGKLNRAREEALASTKAKSEFLSRMSHEIRTPMNAIIGMTTIANKTDDIVKIKYCLDKVDASSRQLLAIINDVLDMSKIDADKFEISNDAFDFDKMLQNVLNVVQVKLEEKQQHFHFETNQAFTNMVVSDELRLSQVLINLLTNAIKFTPESGDITLKVYETPSCDEGRVKIHVDVSDTGIGIGEEAQKKLFNSFEQADGSITRQYGGTGLGLAISKKIIELMGGEIWVESELGKGTTFSFEIEAQLGKKLRNPSTEYSAPEDLRVLVIDDHEDVLEYFSNILAGFSVQCDTASNGRQALEMVKKSIQEEQPYGMVFIDWNMPGMNGGDTAKEIRHITNDHAIVVMISVADWGDIESEARTYGVTNFLPKPVLPSTLYNTILELTHNDLIKEKSPSEDASAADWSNRHILLVEDIEVNRAIVEGMLEETGIHIDNAENGLEAVNMFRQNQDGYDLILMDVQMPVMDGLEATKQIRLTGTERAQTIPIIAMTANAFKEDEQLCLEAGMDRHIAKPLSVDELYSVLTEYFAAADRSRK
ncbi:MAG: response regulator [Christensenellaceae bacterium]